jgi:hypothetical protein
MSKQIKGDLNYVFYFLLFLFSGNMHNRNTINCLIAKWQLEIKVSAGDKHHRAMSIPSHFMAKDQDHDFDT